MSESERVVLVVEDNADDWFLLQRGIKRAGITQTFQHVPDGQQAIDYLQGVNPFSDRTVYPLPVLVLLDLKLPVKHGFEVLSWIRQRPQLNGLAVVIFSSSKAEADLVRAYNSGANAFLVKPTAAEKLPEVLHALDLFWLRNNEFAPFNLFTKRLTS